MKVLIGISHPKQVYMFKNLIYDLKKNGHQYYVVVNEKEITRKLLVEMNIFHQIIGKNKKKILLKIFQIFKLTTTTLIISLAFKPDILVGQALPHFAYTSFFIRKPYIIFEDTENSRLLQKIVNPFAKVIITPSSFQNNLGKRQIKVNGSFELAYLRNNWFVPDQEVLKTLDLKLNDVFAIIRFVSWTANHDVGHKGISTENKIKLVNNFLKFGKVFISSEAELPDELEKYRVNFKVSNMHSMLYYARLVYGESASMAAEAAYLGTPAIFLNDIGRGYTNMLGEYRLVYNFTESKDDQNTSIEKGVEILSAKNKNNWTKKAEALVSQKIDVGSFMNWFVENYPESYKIMKENPDYQNIFK